MKNTFIVIVVLLQAVLAQAGTPLSVTCSSASQILQADFVANGLGLYEYKGLVNGNHSLQAIAGGAVSSVTATPSADGSSIVVAITLVEGKGSFTGTFRRTEGPNNFLMVGTGAFTSTDVTTGAAISFTAECRYFEAESK